MEKKFSELAQFSSQELESIIEETRMGRAPKSLSEQQLKEKKMSKEQLQMIFDRNLSKPHTIAIITHAHVENGLDLYKDHIKKQQDEKINALGKHEKFQKIGKGLQQAANQIERKAGGLKID